MRKIKIFISALLMAAMSVSVVSCGSSDNKKKSGKELDQAVRDEIRNNAMKSDLQARTLFPKDPRSQL